MNLAGKRVLVMGLGRFGGGVDTVRYLAACGAHITVTDTAAADRLSGTLEQLRDLRAVTYHLGGHMCEDFLAADVLIVNPAVPSDNPFVLTAQQHGAEITTPMNLFLTQCPCPAIGITGANGKSTTAALTAHILTQAARQRPGAYHKVWLGGNIGHRPLLTALDHIRPDDVMVLELSSFQTEQLARIRRSTHIGLLTNLTPNHLDRHGTFAAYCRAKEQLFIYQTAVSSPPALSFFCRDDAVGRQWHEKYGHQAGRVCRLYSADDVSDILKAGFRLPGRANLANLAGAAAIARAFDVGDDLMAETLKSFEPLPHRLSLVTDDNGIAWYNDSIATTPESAIVALQAFDRPRILICGGYDKGVSFAELARAISERAKAVILLGQTAPKIAAALEAIPAEKVDVVSVDSLAAAVQQARALAEPGDVVLLSPACASYDMFDNFQERGRAFTCLVESSIDRPPFE